MKEMRSTIKRVREYLEKKSVELNTEKSIIMRLRKKKEKMT